MRASSTTSGVISHASSTIAVASSTDLTSDEAFAQLNGRLKDRFIDYEPGPDIRKYADAIVAGEFSDAS